MKRLYLNHEFVCPLEAGIGRGPNLKKMTDLSANTLDIHPNCRHNHMLDPMRLAVLSLITALFLGCASPKRALQENHYYVTTYYDRNHDGRVDFELHVLPGGADSSWALSDTKFRGRYDVRINFGYAVTHERVNMPVPKNVPITPGNPPVFTTR